MDVLRMTDRHERNSRHQLQTIRLQNSSLPYPTFPLRMTNTNMEQQQSSYKEKERIDLREPRRFKVTIFNDDFTTMEFVVKILTTVFFKSTMEAEALMMQVHKSESAVIGIYTYDIARSKVQKATRMAREEGFPLRLTVTPEEE